MVLNIKNLLIVALLLICGYLCIRVSISQKRLRYVANKMNIYAIENVENKAIIYDYFKYFSINRQDIISLLFSQNLFKSPEDEYIFVIVPQNACGSCASSLFLKLSQLPKITNRNYILLLQSENSILKREWYSYENHSVLVNRNFFYGDWSSKDRILLLKFHFGKENMPFIVYEQELNCLSEFLK